MQRKKGQDINNFRNARLSTVVLQWLKHLWDYENLLEPLRGYYRAKSGGIIGVSFRFLPHEGILCVLIKIASTILLSTHNIPFLNIKKKSS